MTVIFNSCTIQNNYDTTISNYGSWKKNTTNILCNNFTNSLPDSKAVNEYGQKYYYNFSQSAFSDHSFVIYIVMQLPDETSYEKELSKYTALLSNSVVNNNITYYTIQYSHEDVLEYMNNKIYDGMYYNFEIISVDKSKYTISFLNARVWDYYKDQVLIDYLVEIE